MPSIVSRCSSCPPGAPDPGQVRLLLDCLDHLLLTLCHHPDNPVVRLKVGSWAGSLRIPISEDIAVQRKIDLLDLSITGMAMELKVLQVDLEFDQNKEVDCVVDLSLS